MPLQPPPLLLCRNNRNPTSDGLPRHQSLLEEKSGDLASPSVYLFFMNYFIAHIRLHFDTGIPARTQAASFHNGLSITFFKYSLAFFFFTTIIHSGSSFYSADASCRQRFIMQLRWYGDGPLAVPIARDMCSSVAGGPEVTCWRVTCLL